MRRKKTVEIPWFNKDNYPDQKLKNFILIHWWKQLTLRAFVRLQPCCELEGAQFICNVTWIELCRLVKRVGTEDANPEELEILLGCYSLLIRTIKFLQSRKFQSWEKYQKSFIHLNILRMPTKLGLKIFLANLKNFEILFPADDINIKEPGTFLEASHLKQGEIIKLIESKGIVDLEETFSFGDWIYSFPLHWVSIQKKIKEDGKPPVRFASAEEINNFAGNMDAGDADRIPVTGKGRAIVSIPVGMTDQVLKDSLQKFLHTLKEHNIPQRDAAFNSDKWIECGLLQCLDLNHWNDRNPGKLSIQNIVDIATPSKDRGLYNTTTNKWMKKAISADFLSALLERALLEKIAK